MVSADVGLNKASDTQAKWHVETKKPHPMKCFWLCHALPRSNLSVRGTGFEWFRVVWVPKTFQVQKS